MHACENLRSLDTELKDACMEGIGHACMRGYIGEKIVGQYVFVRIKQRPLIHGGSCNGLLIHCGLLLGL